jgi:hypothetical protein
MRSLDLGRGAILMLKEFVHKEEVISQLSSLLRCTELHVEKRVMARDDFPASYKVGAQRLFKTADIEAWVESQKVIKRNTEA